MSKLTRKTALFGLGIAVMLSACASVQSDFDLSFFDTPGFDDQRLERIDEAVAAEDRFDDQGDYVCRCHDAL
jgi:hypothetical protein